MLLLFYQVFKMSKKCFRCGNTHEGEYNICGNCIGDLSRKEDIGEKIKSDTVKQTEGTMRGFRIQNLINSIMSIASVILLWL